jgi:PAS domain S-box-containing protein
MSPSVVVVHIDEKIVLVNPAGVTLLGGKTEQDILGQNLIEQFFLPEYREVGRKRARIVNETGEAVSPREYRFRRLDGTIIDVEATGKAIAYEGRKAILSMYHDITERKRAEAAILESQGKYRQLVNYAPTGIYEIDYWNQRIVSVNDAMCQATGYTREELLSMNPGELLTDDSKPLFVERLQRILSNQPVSGEVEFKIKTKQGQEKWALLNTNFIYENGILRGATVVAHDITDRKKAEEDLLLSREIFSKAFEVSPDWISLSTLAEGRYIDVNNVYLQMTGRQRKEVVGRTSLEINLWADPRDRLKGLEIIREKGSLKNLEVKFRMKSGEIRDILWSAEVIDIKGQQCLLSVCHDITDRKKAEAEIRDLNITLDKRVQERTAQLEEANKELEGFSYSISHDLRTPLRHITGFVNLLLKQTDTRQLDEKSRHYLNVISDSAVKMGQLIDDLLSFSRLGRQEISRSQINLNILVGDVLKDIETEWENREVNWSIASLPEIYGDLPLLKIVFENLLSNALKFTRKKSRADIEIGTLSNPAEEVIIYVKDNGDGFNMAYGAKLFKLFQRLHHERDFEGTGLGLANVRRIINRHGGRTWAEGRPGLGATFYFSLPQRTSQR